ncbi:MAG: aspartate aminotransferase family protein [Candidatus Heimdallarchaeota archaeon]
MFIKDEVEEFQRKRPRSHELWKTAVKALAGGVSHNIRTFGLPTIGAFPVFVKSSKGANLTDIDDNSYIDCWNGHFAMILGHNHPRIREVILQQINQGWHFGTTTDLQIRLSEQLITDNPGIEKIRFCTSGTEATMYACRLARAYTGRRLIAKAKLGWHGANDTLSYAVGGMLDDRSTPGILEPQDAGIITFDINSTDSIGRIKGLRENLAAVILEPVMGGGGGFSVNFEFLKELKEELDKMGALLIYDEVITGYRFRYGLYQNVIKVIPDLTTMGKIIGGGFPIGAVGGQHDIIDRAIPGRTNSVLIGGGTFSGFPVSLTAGLKTLELLRDSQAEYDRINSAGELLKQNLNNYFREEKLPILATGMGSIVMLHTLSEWIEDPSIPQIVKLTDKKRAALLQLALFNRDIAGLHGLGCISMAHTKENVSQIQQTVLEVASPISSATDWPT